MSKSWKNEFNDSMGRIGEFAKQSPNALSGLTDISTPSDKPLLDPKTVELIALAVAVTTRCDGCIAAHAKKAAKLGVTEAEISEALNVAISLNAGAAMMYSSRALEAVREFS
ncbi:carboxymuconolactone decarboxylase family protein [Vibrio sp.]|nr:carboxymuconolactone decarboxylase family protein [Vibrio sp.]